MFKQPGQHRQHTLTCRFTQNCVTRQTAHASKLQAAPSRQSGCWAGAKGPAVCVQREPEGQMQAVHNHSKCNWILSWRGSAGQACGSTWGGSRQSSCEGECARASCRLSMLCPQDLSKGACLNSAFIDTAWPALQKRPPLYRTMLHDDSNRRWACPDTSCMQA